MEPRTVAYRRMGLQAIARQAWGQPFEVMMGAMAGIECAPFEVDGDAAIVTIRGPLTHHRHFVWDSYESILERNRAAFADTSTKRVIWMIDSPGGDVDGCFETTYAIRDLMEASGKRLEVYTDSMAASAAYALACAASRIVCSPTGALGSIGIIETLCSVADADAKAGVKYEFITSGERKADGNPHTPISEGARANLQRQVDQMADVFFSLVEEFRGISLAKVRGLQARMLYGQAAVDVGLADELGMWPTLAHEPSGTAQSGQPAAQLGTGVKMKAGYLRHMLRSIAESKDDEISDSEKKHAKRMLKSLEEGDSDDGAPVEKKEDKEKEGRKAEGKKAEGEGEGKTRAEGEGEGEDEAKKAAEAKKKAEAEDEAKKKAEAAHKARAEGEGEGRRAEDESEGKKAISAMSARLMTLESRESYREEQSRRTKLMASRPDLTDEVRAWLDSESLEVVERAVKTLPKGPTRSSQLAKVAAGSQAMGSRGRTQTEDVNGEAFTPDHERDFIARKMGAQAPHPGIKNVGKSQELGFMTPEEASAFLKKKAAAQPPAPADGQE